MTDAELPGAAFPRLPEMIPGRVTAIVTCFNGARWIQSAVDSALAQTYRNNEIIIVDDASTDESVQMLESYRGLSKVTLIFHRENRGISAAKNSGLQSASGEFVAFLDQDDEWHKQKLEKLVGVLKPDRGIGAMASNLLIVDCDGWEFTCQLPAPIPHSSRRAAVETIFSRNPLSIASALLRRSCLEEVGGFEPRSGGADDYELWLRLAERFRIGFLKEVLTRHLVHAGSYSMSRADRQLEEVIATVEQAVVRYPFLAPLKTRVVAQKYVSAAMKALASGRSSDSRRLAIRALSTSPGFPRAHVALALALSGRAGKRLLNSGRRWHRSAGQRQSGPGWGSDNGIKVFQ